jgi:SlyX protein
MSPAATSRRAEPMLFKTGSDMETLAARLLELEVKTAYQDRTIEDLNDVVLELRGEIDKLRRDFEALQSEAQSADKPIGPGNEPPPHY